jgi:hypothetical protein
MTGYKMEGKIGLTTASVYQRYVLPTYQGKFPAIKGTGA